MKKKEKKKKVKQEKVMYESIVKLRILEFLTVRKISQYACCKKAQITRGILGQKSGMSEQNLLKFLEAYPEVNSDWLLFGKGKMIKDSVFEIVSDIKDDIEIVDMKMAAEQSPSYTKDYFLYKIYKDKDTQVGVLQQEVGTLKERVRHLEKEVSVNDKEK